MNKSYVIQWKSKVNGRAGKGTHRFEREAAERLAAELNREYPDIHHEPLDTSAVGSLGAPPGNPVSEPETERQDDETTAEPVRLFSAH